LANLGWFQLTQPNNTTAKGDKTMGPNELKAKMKVYSNKPGSLAGDGSKASEQVTLSAVWSDDKNSENYSYSQATPNATLNMYISNPQAFGFFEEGAEYVLTFERVS
jgi:hypothetical protein